ncbi:hypothetical protein Tco_0415522 [Tanacetum coccineum]
MFDQERKCFEIKEKELLLENERLLEHILYQDVICIAMWKRIFEKRTKNEAKNDKIEHGIEKRGQVKVNQKVNPDKVNGSKPNP